MDSFVFLLSLYDNGFRPLPLIFAGITMNFLGLRALCGAAGAGRPGQAQEIAALIRERPPRFGHAILRSITEAYLVIAVTLLELEGQPAANRKQLTASLMAQGEQMLLRRTISCEASVSQDLFTNGLRLAEYQALLTGGSAGLRQRREAFAEQVVTALSAINLLQRCYDAAWFSQLSAGRVANLLGP